jgi:hypothetical protein
MKQIKITKKIINSTKLLHDKELEVEQIFKKNFSKESWVKYFKNIFLELGLKQQETWKIFDDRYFYEDDKIKYDVEIYPQNYYYEIGIELYVLSLENGNYKTVEFKKSEIIEAAKFINDFIRIAEIVSKMEVFSK